MFRELKILQKNFYKEFKDSLSFYVIYRSFHQG